jgi:hypothetical protein
VQSHRELQMKRFNGLLVRLGVQLSVAQWLAAQTAGANR